MNNNNTAAPSITIAPRNPAKGVLNFVVTLTTFKDVRSYPPQTPSPGWQPSAQPTAAFHATIYHQRQPLSRNEETS